jgi:uncharacterized protein
MTAISRYLWPKRRRFMAWVFTLLVLCVVISGFLSFYLLRLPRFLGASIEANPSIFRHEGYCELQTRTADGVMLSGYGVFLADNLSASGTVILCHGWGAGRHDIDQYALHFMSLGYNVVGYDFRGHGDSGGSTSHLGLNEVSDMRAILADLRSNKLLTPPLVLFGVSMGASVAIATAAGDSEAVAVIAESPFNSLESEVDYYVARAYPFLPKYPIRWLAFRFAELQIGRSMKSFRVQDSLDELSPRPLFLYHNEGDTLVPVYHSDEIARAYGEHAQYWKIPGGDHLSVMSDHEELLKSKLDGFLREVRSE